VNNYISTFTSLSSDTLILIILAVAFLFLGFRKGKDVLVTGLLSLYVTAFLYSNAFFVNSLIFVAKDPAKLFWNHLAIFILFFVPVYLILSKIILAENDRGPLGLIKMAILSLVTTGLLITIFYHVVPISTVYNFSSAVDSLFESSRTFTVWLILPLAALFF
jgi:hypothetical protein